MLPILRTITIGGVFLAFAISVLALHPPDGSRVHFAYVSTSPRGPLIDRTAHPEWRQMLLLAAFRRAAELKELRNILDKPPPPAPKPTTKNTAGAQLAALPIDRCPGSSAPNVPTAIPVGIGEASSTELPVVPHVEQPPVAAMPTPNESIAPSQPTQQPAMHHKKPDEAPTSTGEFKPLKFIVPTQPAPKSVQRQAVRQEKLDMPPVSTAEIKPLEIIVPTQPAPKPAQRQAKREGKPDMLPAAASAPQAARAKPAVATAGPCQTSAGPRQTAEATASRGPPSRTNDEARQDLGPAATVRSVRHNVRQLPE